MDRDEIGLEQLSWPALFKLGFVANLAIWAPLGLIFSIAALFGLNTVRRDGVPIHGPAGFLLGCIVGLIFIALGTLLFAIGARIASKFYVRLRLRATDEP